MNNSFWNLKDDEYYVVNRRWFDHWKSYIAYDYIVHTLLEKKKVDCKHYLLRVGELSVNQLMVNGKVRPPPVSNRNILLEPKKYYSRMDTSNVHKDDVTGYPMVENAKMD